MRQSSNDSMRLLPAMKYETLRLSSVNERFSGIARSRHAGAGGCAKGTAAVDGSVDRGGYAMKKARSGSCPESSTARRIL